MSFFDRLNYYEQEKGINYQKLQSSYHNNFFSNSNQFNINSENKSHISGGMNNVSHYSNQIQEPFRPRTGRNPINRNTNNMPVGMYLYEKGFMQYKKKIQAKNEFEQDLKQKQSLKNTNTMSDKIVEAIKFKRLEEVFNVLDSDNDGVICNSKIDISQLPTNILKTIAPLLIEMEQMNLILD